MYLKLYLESFPSQKLACIKHEALLSAVPQGIAGSSAAQGELSSVGRAREEGWGPLRLCAL